MFRQVLSINAATASADKYGFVGNNRFHSLSDTSIINDGGVISPGRIRCNRSNCAMARYSNVTGDGSLKTIPIPFYVFNNSKPGFIRISSP